MRRDEDGQRRPRRVVRLLRAAAWLAVLVVLGYLAGFVAFADYIARMRSADPPPEADAVIVLTGGHFRLGPAVDLLRAGRGKRLLISGVHPDTDSRSLRQATGADEALFACCIDLDTVATDTTGNAVESARWLRANNFTSAILVTNNYHIPRSMLEMRRAMPEMRIIAYPVVNARLDGFRWLANREVLRVLFIEYAKFVAAYGRSLIA